MIDAPRPANTGSSMWLVRHGETAWARSGRHTGLTDIKLTALGREQALELAPRLFGHPFANVVSSPLSRALDTAHLAGFGERVEIVPDLVEWDYGQDEGRTSDDIRAERPGWTIWTDGPLGGEAIDVLGARVDRVIEKVRRTDGVTLAFAHGHVLRALAARWLGLPVSAGAMFALDTATISILDWDRGTPIIQRWNDGIDLD